MLYTFSYLNVTTADAVQFSFVVFLRTRPKGHGQIGRWVEVGCSDSLGMIKVAGSDELVLTLCKGNVSIGLALLIVLLFANCCL